MNEDKEQKSFEADIKRKEFENAEYQKDINENKENSDRVISIFNFIIFIMNSIKRDLYRRAYLTIFFF